MAHRGTYLSPGNRFTTLTNEHFDDEWEDRSPEPDPRTRIVEDTSRAAFATNKSPDIPFTHSINPYRGCEHGCTYCLSGETPILLADGRHKSIADLKLGEKIIGTERQGWYRHYVPTAVLAHWKTKKQAYQITLEDGTELITSGNHRFLTERGWKHVIGFEQGRLRRPHLTLQNKMMGVGQFALPPQQDVEYMKGYLCGMIRGDGHIGYYEYSRAYKKHDKQWRFRLALVDYPGIARTQTYLSHFGIQTDEFIYQVKSEKRRGLRAIRTSCQDRVEAIMRLVDFPDRPSHNWYRGFLAGIFDAEGGYSDGVMRISNTDQQILANIEQGLNCFGFHWVYDVERRQASKVVHSIRILQGLREHLRFFHLIDPVIRRKCSIDGIAIKSDAKLKVVDIAPLGRTIEMFDITTGTQDFIANGVVSHNCYARPTHEYLGFNAGIDFESIIVVKRNAAELARQAMMKKSWKPTSVSISGVTDPYQPLERQLKITRSILEVMLEFRNPVGIVTKNALVCRDLDLLAELAEQGCVMVFLSITTLDRDLARRMEPRTSTPELRLRAIERLASAGIPVGTMVAPIIPGLNEEEIPSILQAAADAGARSAAHVILRLPLAVKPIFLDWLDREEPGRAKKVRNALREMKGESMNQTEFGARMTGAGERAKAIKRLFSITAKRLGLNSVSSPITTANFQRPGVGGQMKLF